MTSRRWPRARRLAIVIGLGVATLAPPARAGDPADEERARRAVHLLEYLAADYPGAVHDGQIADPLEYS